METQIQNDYPSIALDIRVQKVAHSHTSSAALGVLLWDSTQSFIDGSMLQSYSLLSGIVSTNVIRSSSTEFISHTFLNLRSLPTYITQLSFLLLLQSSNPYHKDYSTFDLCLSTETHTLFASTGTSIPFPSNSVGAQDTFLLARLVRTPDGFIFHPEDTHLCSEDLSLYNSRDLHQSLQYEKKIFMRSIEKAHNEMVSSKKDDRSDNDVSGEEEKKTKQKEEEIENQGIAKRLFNNLMSRARDNFEWRRFFSRNYLFWGVLALPFSLVAAGPRAAKFICGAVGICAILNSCF